VTAGPVTILPFSEDHYLRRLAGIDPIHRGQKCLPRPAVERLVRDMVGEVKRAKEGEANLIAERDQAREALKYHADDYAAQHQPYERPGPPSIVVDAAVNGQLAIERNARNGTAELSRRFAEVRRMEDEVRAMLAKAKETAAAGPPVLVLPPEPKANRDPIAEAAAQGAHIRACRDAIAQHREELAAYERAVEQALAEVDEHQRKLDAEEATLGERRDDVLAKLHQVGEDRARVEADVEAIDLTGGGAVDLEATQAMEVAS
jgi:hypothetical protein